MLMLRATGLLLVILGIMWALQGAGLLEWPADSFMLGEQGWMWRGLGAAAAGAIILGLVQWRQRR